MLRDPSGWKPKLDAEVIARYRVEGAWRDRTIADRLDDLCERQPGQTLVVDGVRSLSAAKVRKLARRLGRVLAERGLRPGHVVSFQLPNWHEAVLIEVACAYAGYVCNPIVPIYRDAEVSFILADAGSRVLFVPESFREFDYRTMVDRMRTDLPRLGEVVFVRPRDSSLLSFEQFVREPANVPLKRPDPKQREADLVHLGHDQPRQGSAAHAQHHRCRDPQLR